VVTTVSVWTHPRGQASTLAMGCYRVAVTSNNLNFHVIPNYMTISKILKVISFAFSFIASHAMGETPCDFKGVSVGDKVTPEIVMKTLGIKSYKTYHSPWTAKELEAYIKLKYEYEGSPMMASEYAEAMIGPFCNDTLCQIPPGEVKIGNDIPAKILIFFSNGVVTKIQVRFNNLYWNEVKPILHQKYKATWHIESDPTFFYIDPTTREKQIPEDYMRLTHKYGGMNKNTGDRCQIWTANYDGIFTHTNYSGGYLLSIFVIKLISKNF
jgi:hypothetical protein